VKKNLGSADRAIRAVLGVVVLILILTNTITGTVAAILGIVAAALLITSAIGFCPAYLPLKISTLGKPTKE
jgi:hypothetical protein